jgi:hypothetical protein
VSLIGRPVAAITQSLQADHVEVLSKLAIRARVTSHDDVSAMQTQSPSPPPLARLPRWSLRHVHRDERPPAAGSDNGVHRDERRHPLPSHGPTPTRCPATAPRPPAAQPRPHAHPLPSNGPMLTCCGVQRFEVPLLPLRPPPVIAPSPPPFVNR